MEHQAHNSSYLGQFLTRLIDKAVKGLIKQLKVASLPKFGLRYQTTRLYLTITIYTLFQFIYSFV